MFENFTLKSGLNLLVITLASVLICYFLPSIAKPLQVAENWFRDFRVAAFSETLPYDERVVVVTINEDTLSRFPYRSPVDRELLAEVLVRLEAAGARAVAIDVLLDTPTEPAKDAQLKQVLDQADIPIIAAYATPESSGGRINKEQLEFLDRMTENIERGFANVVVDPSDHVVRSIYPGWSDPKTDDLFDGMAQLLAAEGDADVSRFSDADADYVPLDYRGHPEDDLSAFVRRPAHTLLLFPPAVLRKWFEGKLVLIGADLSDVDLDLKRTPWLTLFPEQGYFPGVIIHAHAVAQILDDRSFPDLAEWLQILLIMAMTLMGALFGRSTLHVLLLGVLLLFTLLAFWSLGVGLYWRPETRIMIPLLFPTIAFIIGLVGSIALFGNEQREQKKFIRDAFSRYLSPDLVGQLVDDPESLKIQGEKRELSFIFTDVAGFTSFTEAVEPELLVQVLNEYLDGMCAHIMEHNGTIDKFIGDAVFVIFGAPVPDPEHAANAVRCALALNEYASEFHKRMRSIGIPFGITRIGVHTGVATVGNFGSENRFEYTALGDAVNAAARLESLNKQFGTTTAISGNTVDAARERIGDSVNFRPIASVIVKGKTEPIDIYQPLSPGDGQSAVVQAYAAAYELMQKGLEEARTAFESLKEKFPDDHLIRLHQARLAREEATPPTHIMKLDEK